MKKRLFTTLIASCITLLGMSQAVLPASWGFTTTTLPTGWASSGTGFGYYSGSGNPAPAAKFSVAGDMLTIDFTTTPGNLVYDIKANVATPPGNPYGGTFLVEESPNGTTWTTLHSHTTMSITAYTTITDVPQNTTRHIRFNMSVKTNGNVSIDNVSIAAGVSTAAQIIVKQGTTTIVNGGTYTMGSPVSTLLPTTFTVQNLGTVGTLSVTVAAITGPAAADYSVTTTMPLNVAPTSTGSLVVNFTPSVAGTRNAILTLTNNDPTGSPYVINLNGIGGNFATEPTAQATNLTFPISKSYHVQVQFTAASPAPDGYLVLRKTGSAITDAPVDGTVYQRGDIIGNSKVCYSASTTSFYPNEIVANTNYYFAVFAYNGVGIYRNYYTVAPLTGNVTSSGNMQPPTYYNTINTASATFVTDLHTLTNPHTIQFYSSYGALFAATFYSRDTVANQRVITCVYSGENKVYTEPFDWTTENFSREHTYCQSWQPSVNCSNFQNLGEYNDYHMITPTDQNNVNAIRSNYPLGVVVGTPTYTYLGCKVGLDANGHKVFEPRDADKGDAARCMFYECITYTGETSCTPANTTTTYGGTPVAGTNIWSLPSICYNPGILYAQDPNVLEAWNTQDPPDNFEIARNDYVDSLQGNRNPFIDHPEYACLINFGTMTKVVCNTGINEISNSFGSAIIYPNPANDAFAIMINDNSNTKANIAIMNMLGEQVATLSNLENNNGLINCSDLNIANGLYMVKIYSGDKTFVSRVMINK